MSYRFRFSRPLASYALAALVTGSLFAPAHAQRQRAGGNPFAPPAATYHTPRQRDYDLQNLKLVFDVNAADQSAHGVVTHTLAPIKDNLAAIVLDAGPNLKIESCTLDGAAVPFTHEGDKLTLTPATPLAKSKAVNVAIAYTMPRTNVAGGANGLGGFKWIDPTPGTDRVPMFWTQGETETNRNWVPCYDSPNDKCTSEEIVTVPEGWQVIGNGAQLKTTHDAAKKTATYHWKMTQPHSTYLLSLVGGELDIKMATWQGKPLYYVVPKGKAELIDGSFGNTPDMLSFFSRILDYKYPWPKYAQDAVFDFGGGMENVSATTLGAGSLVDKRSGHFLMSSLNSHELAHQWFGDTVTCEDWGDVWLNESFATYFQMLYARHLEGEDAFQSEIEGNTAAYVGESRRYKRPVSTHLYSNGDVMFDAHTYPKGGVILHMLNVMLGDHDFFLGLNTYLHTHEFQPVNAYDLLTSMEAGTGKTLRPFFEQWIFKPGHPVLDATWTYDGAGKAVVVTLKQTQDTGDGTPVYNIPVTFGLLTSKGEGKNVHLTRQTVTLTQTSQTFRLPLGEKPAALLLDPDRDLLKEVPDKHLAANDLQAQMLGAPSWLDRRDAARAYAASGDGLNAGKGQVLANALKLEKSDRQAVVLLQLLGDASGKGYDARPALHEQIKMKSPDRKAAALLALGKLPKTADDMTLLRQYALSDVEPYNVVEASMNALATLDAPGSLDVFRHQAQAHSLRDRLTVAAVNAASDAKLDAALPLYLDVVKSDKAVFARTAAIRALAPLAPGDAQVHTALMGLLGPDQAPLLETAVIRALRDRKDKDAVPALRTLATDAKSEQVRDAAKSAADDLEGK